MHELDLHVLEYMRYITMPQYITSWTEYLYLVHHVLRSNAVCGDLPGYYAGQLDRFYTTELKSSQIW